jgi:DNA-binding PadR family transcriptional regulator
MEKVKNEALVQLEQLEKTLEEDYEVWKKMGEGLEQEMATVKRLKEKITTTSVKMELKYKVAEPPSYVELAEEAGQLTEAKPSYHTPPRTKGIQKVYRPGLEQACVDVVNCLEGTPLSIKKIAERILIEFPETPSATIATALRRAERKGLVGVIRKPRTKGKCSVFYTSKTAVAKQSNPEELLEFPKRKVYTFRNKPYNSPQALSDACVKIIENKDRLLSAAEIAYYLDKLYGVPNSVGKSTLYRYLSELVKEGRIKKQYDYSRALLGGDKHPVAYSKA